MSDSDEAPKKATKAKGTKRKKDPNAPKRPLSSFMFFCQAKRADFQTANPSAKFAELGKILGAAWAEVSVKEKAVYDAQNKEAKAEYEVAKANYKGGGDDDDDDDGGKKKGKSAKPAKKAKKDKDAPKSAPSAYVLFCTQERPKLKAKHPDATFGELGTLLGAAWKALDNDAKEPFNAEHATKKKIADAKKKEYEEEHGKPEKTKKAKKDKKKKKTADDDDEEEDGGSDDE